MRRVAVVVALTTALLLIAAPAMAHVTVRVDDPAPGAYAEYTLRVPNESDSASTTQVRVELPEGLEPRVQPVPGWDVTVERGVLTVSGGEIAPGQYQDFTFVAQNPEDGGEARFPAIQTYDDGEVAEWIGEPDSERPASVVAYEGEATSGDAHTAGGGHEEGTVAEGEETAAESSGGGTDWMPVIALIAGLAGLILGGLAFAHSGGAGGARPATPAAGTPSQERAGTGSR